jgi:hypothetical protein
MEKAKKLMKYKQYQEAIHIHENIFPNTKFVPKKEIYHFIKSDTRGIIKIKV